MQINGGRAWAGGPPLRAGVVGVGRFGRHHARIYSEMADAGIRLVGLVDVDLERPRPLAERLGVPLVERVEDLPEPLDLVSVVVPTALHRRVAAPLLQRGIHCLVEKPLGGTVEEAEGLMEAAAAGGSCLQVGLVERFNPVLQALERLGEPPVFVEIQRLSPPTPGVTDVGVVLDLMIHDLDLLGLLVRSEVTEIEATGVCMLGPHEDLASARIGFHNGCVALVTASRVAERRVRTMRVYTRVGYLELDCLERTAWLVRPADSRTRGRWGSRVADLAARRPEAEGRPPYFEPTFHGLLRRERVPLPAWEPLRAQIESVIGAVRDGREPPVSGTDGLRALHQAQRVLAAIAHAAGDASARSRSTSS